MSHKFTKKDGKPVSKAIADERIKRWKDKGHKTESVFFGSDLLNELINTPNSVGIRIHFAEDEHGTMAPILTAQIEASLTPEKTLDSSTIYGNASMSCPPYC